MDNQKVNGAVGARETGHSLLSASSAHRWLNCPPSARAGRGLRTGAAIMRRKERPPISSLVQAEGGPGNPGLTPPRSHLLRRGDGGDGQRLCRLSSNSSKPQNKTVPTRRFTSRRSSDFSKYVAGGFGTADCLIVADGTSASWVSSMARGCG